MEWIVGAAIIAFLVVMWRVWLASYYVAACVNRLTEISKKMDDLMYRIERIEKKVTGIEMKYLEKQWND